jgi:membrane-associated phospholipid phosphatase
MLNPIDLYFFRHIPHFSSPILHIFTAFADPKIHLFIWGLISLILFFRKKGNIVLTKPFYFFTLTNGIMLFCGVLKILFGRARPFLLEKQIVGYKFFTLEDPYLSFPSSHTAMAAALSFSIYKLFKCSPSILIFPIGIMATRLFLREHFFSDVIVGFCIGLILSLVTEKGFAYKKKLRG